MFVCRDFGIYKLRCSNFHSLNTYFVTQSFLWIFENFFSKWQCTRLNGLNMINFMNHVFLPKGSYFATITLFIWAKQNFFLPPYCTRFVFLYPIKTKPELPYSKKTPCLCYPENYTHVSYTKPDKLPVCRAFEFWWWDEIFNF